MIKDISEKVLSRRAALGKLGLLGLAFLVPATAAIDEAEAKRRRQKEHKERDKAHKERDKKKHHRRRRKHGHH
jgi:hypothetical protein